LVQLLHDDVLSLPWCSTDDCGETITGAQVMIAPRGGVLARRASRVGRLLAVLLACAATPPPSAVMAEKAAACTPQSFKCFVEDLWPLAQQRNVSRAVFDAAFSGMTPDTSIMALTKAQPEYNRPVGQYVGSRVSVGAISSSRQQIVRWSDTLERAEREFGVEREILVSIWGLESGFGAVKGERDIIRSLATLAHARYRDVFFRDELLAALEILQSGDVPRARLVGSWAGAMGQPQFLPSSFLRHAVDFSNDKRRDIWTNVPDVLGSMASYLKNFGWRRGLPWGFEVVVPQGYDFRFSRGSFSTWAARGLRRSDDAKLSGDDEAYLLFPSGARGPAFLVTENYVAIKRYNFSDPYALAVAHLADRMRGGGPWHASWPEDDRPLTRDNRIALQRGLSTIGFKVGNFVGHIDFDQRDMIRQMQGEAGMVRDGNPTDALLAFVRQRASGPEDLALRR
jgi:lytic murein transglycosylase